MTKEKLAEIEARCNAATPGRWYHWEGDCRVITSGPMGELCTNIAECASVGDTEFIAHARQDIPALIEAVRAFNRD